jgi:hypothetical protein
LAAACSASASTNDFNRTSRVIQGARVDLKPLAAWLKIKPGDRLARRLERPLTAWKVVRLAGVMDTNRTWAVTAEVEGAKEDIVLRNPPQREWAEFNQLKTQYEQLTTWTNQVGLAIRRVEAERKYAVAEEADLRQRTFKAGMIAPAQARVALLTRQAIALYQDLAAAQQQLLAIESRGYDLEKPFTFDCLALQTTEKAGARTVFDRGQSY